MVTRWILSKFGTTVDHEDIESDAKYLRGILKGTEIRKCVI